MVSNGLSFNKCKYLFISMLGFFIVLFIYKFTMQKLRIIAGSYTFIARMEEVKAPKTCQAFKRLLPFKNKIIQARWSGEAAWIPLGEFKLDVGYENHTSYPSRGDI